MGNFFAELKRRHIYRVAAAYTVVAWLVLQLVNNVAPVLDLPPWVARTILLVLVIGFPFALLLAWIVEAAPEPARGKGKRGVAQPVADSRVDWVLAGALALVIGIFAYQQLAPSPPAANQQASVEAVRAAAATQAGISIAVLPFTNLSSDAEQEFFSDGITEELTAALAKVPDLRVVGRTSAFQFKGQNQDLRSIGQSLAATHLIEGSVRKAGTRVRITAQLIKTDDGTHLWSENYDRELTDIFAIQEDIATAIAGALRAPLGLKQGESLVSNRTSNVESYQDYLRAKAIFRGRVQSRFSDAIALLDQVLARDPGFAPAWALLAYGYDRIALTAPAALSGSAEEARRMSESRPRGEMAAQRAIQLNPNLPDGYVSLGTLQLRHGKVLLAEELVSKALALDPNYPDALAVYSSLLLGVGRLKEALATSQKMRLLEPFAPDFNFYAIFPLWLNGQNDAAIALLDSQPPGSRARILATIYVADGRYGEASRVLSETPSAFPPGTAEAAIPLLRTAPAPARSPQTLPRLGNLGFVYLHVGAPDRVLESYEEAVQRESLIFIGSVGLANLWHPSYAPVRKTERFKIFVRKAGLVDYWRAKGWPEFCHPTSGDDFVCE